MVFQPSYSRDAERFSSPGAPDEDGHKPPPPGGLGGGINNLKHSQQDVFVHPLPVTSQVGRVLIKKWGKWHSEQKSNMYMITNEGEEPFLSLSKR